MWFSQQQKQIIIILLLFYDAVNATVLSAPRVKDYFVEAVKWEILWETLYKIFIFRDANPLNHPEGFIRCCRHDHVQWNGKKVVESTTRVFTNKKCYKLWHYIVVPSSPLKRVTKRKNKWRQTHAPYRRGAYCVTYLYSRRWRRRK